MHKTYLFRKHRFSICFHMQLVPHLRFGLWRTTLQKWYEGSMENLKSPVTKMIYHWPLGVVPLFDLLAHSLRPQLLFHPIPCLRSAAVAEQWAGMPGFEKKSSCLSDQGYCRLLSRYITSCSVFQRMPLMITWKFLSRCSEARGVQGHVGHQSLGDVIGMSNLSQPISD